MGEPFPILLLESCALVTHEVHYEFVKQKADESPKTNVRRDYGKVHQSSNTNEPSAYFIFGIHYFLLSDLIIFTTSSVADARYKFQFKVSCSSSAAL